LCCWYRLARENAGFEMIIRRRYRYVRGNECRIWTTVRTRQQSSQSLLQPCYFQSSVAKHQSFIHLIHLKRTFATETDVVKVQTRRGTLVGAGLKLELYKGRKTSVSGSNKPWTLDPRKMVEFRRNRIIEHRLTWFETSCSVRRKRRSVRPKRMLILWNSERGRKHRTSIR
jgi:hypothetical protein